MPYRFGIFTFWVLLALIGTTSVFAQKETGEGKTTQVQFNAATMQMDKEMGNGAKRLIGNVEFTHEGAKMYCDSAYFYSELNSLDAFSNIYINQGDTLFLYGDELNYNGNTKLAKVKRNVRLINQDITLETKLLDYDLRKGIGYYTTRALITSEENTLESDRGYYYTHSEWMHFRDSVVITNPEYVIYCDTLKYQTETKKAYFFGPTEIVGDTNYIYCEHGWYDTKNNLAELNQNALVRNPKQSLQADSIYFERDNGYGFARHNVVMIDLEQDVVLTGNRGYYYQDTDFALMTDSAVFIQLTGEDSIFVHADTLRSFPDEKEQKVVQAYYGVRLYKTDLQGKCDSMVYTFADSTAFLYGAPVLWSDENQIMASHIRILNKAKEIDRMFLERDAMIISMVDSSKFNQIKGKNMICYFAQNKIDKIDVRGNGQSVYYPLDEEEVIGVNKLECSNMVIFMAENQVKDILFLVKPQAILYPVEEAPVNELILRGFNWFDDIRPKKVQDIFK